MRLIDFHDIAANSTTINLSARFDSFDPVYSRQRHHRKLDIRSISNFRSDCEIAIWVLFLWFHSFNQIWHLPRISLWDHQIESNWTLDIRITGEEGGDYGVAQELCRHPCAAILLHTHHFLKHTDFHGVCGRSKLRWAQGLHGTHLHSVDFRSYHCFDKGKSSRFTEFLINVLDLVKMIKLVRLNCALKLTSDFLYCRFSAFASNESFSGQALLYASLPRW